MGRTVTVIWHALFSIVAAGLFFFFVLPRWPELSGHTSPTLGLVLRIVTGALIGLAALPVVFTLRRTGLPELATPAVALRLRSVSIVLHVVAGVLIVGTAVAEIWLSLDDFGPWLFGIYGAAAAIALLGIFAFYLAFAAELPPPPPKPVKTRTASTRRGRNKKAQDAAANGDTDEDTIDQSAADDDSSTAGSEDPDDETAAQESSADEQSDPDEDSSPRDDT